MVRRTPPQAKTDDWAFPVRVKVIVPAGGLGIELFRAHDWLRKEIGRGNYACHSAGHAAAFYFRSTEAARRFLAEFSIFELADGTRSPGYTSPALTAGRRRLE